MAKKTALVLALLLLFGACASPPPQTQSPSAGVEAAAGATPAAAGTAGAPPVGVTGSAGSAGSASTGAVGSAEAGAAEEPEPPPSDQLPGGCVEKGPDADFSFLIDLDWPNETEAYKPSVGVFPLTNSGAVYKTGVSGAVTFVGEDLRAIELPFSPSGFGYIRGVGDLVCGYVLYGEGDAQFGALMLTDGSVPLDAAGRYYTPVDIGHNEPWHILAGSALVVFRPPPPGAEWAPPLYGVYDLRERRESLPYEFEAISSIDGLLFVAKKEGEIRLLSVEGNELYAFDPTEDLQVYTQYGWFADEHYVLDARDRVFYRRADTGFARSIGRWGGYVIVAYADTTDAEYGIYDSIDRIMYQVRFDAFYQNLNEYLVFRKGELCLVLNEDFEEAWFFIPGLEDYDTLLFYDGVEIVYACGGNEDDPEQRYMAADADGNLRSLTWAEADQAPILYRYPGRFLFVDPALEVLAETEGYFTICGDFVVKKEYVGEDYSMRNDPKSVYALDGRLLLDGIFGCIDEAVGPDGGLIVYLNANACVLLHPDGATIPIPEAPRVELVYWGG